MVKRCNKTKNPDIEIRELDFTFYLNPYIKKQYIRIIDVLFETHEKTFKSLYERLVTNTDEVQNRC